MRELLHRGHHMLSYPLPMQVNFRSIIWWDAAGEWGGRNRAGLILANHIKARQTKCSAGLHFEQSRQLPPSYLTVHSGVEILDPGQSDPESAEKSNFKK